MVFVGLNMYVGVAERPRPPAVPVRPLRLHDLAADDAQPPLDLGARRN